MIYPRRKTEKNEKNISPFCISSHLCEQNYECILKKNVDQPKGLKNQISPQKIKSCIWYEMCFQKLSEILKRFRNIIIMHGFTFQAFGT